MLSRSLKEQIKCRWREFRREPSAFFWVVFMPILWMVVLGFALSDPKPEVYGVGWLTSAQTEFNKQIELENTVQHALTSSHQIQLKAGTEDELRPLLSRGEIVIMATWEKSGLKLFFDPTNPEAKRAEAFINDLAQRAIGRVDPLPVQQESITAHGTRYVDFLVPGLLGLSIMTSSLFGVGMTIVSNRKENLLKRYIATPMRPYEYIVSHLVGRLNILAAEFIAVMVAAYAIFQFKVIGSFSAYILFSILGASAFTGIALLCAARTRSIPMISGLTNLISLPMIMLSGVFFSKNNFPDWLRSVTDFLPLTALNDGLRKIALEGQGLSHLGFEISILAACTIITALFSLKLFRWY